MNDEPVVTDGSRLPLRVLVLHNRYQHRGGEDSVVESEVEMLRDAGHQVCTYERDNHEVDGASRLALARDTVWSSTSHRDVGQAIAGFSPDVVHVHNTLPLISPSAYWAAAGARVPVVQTLHNFRLHCPQAMYLRDGKVCEDCLGQVPWRAVVHRCYRDSAAQSAAIAGMLVLHRAIGTWRNKVTRYIALNEFCRRKVIEGGLPAERVVVKPNFVRSTPPGDGTRSGLLFVGRLSVEKGVEALAGALARAPELSVRIAGDGPAAGLLLGSANATMLGSLPIAEVMREMASATALVLPSVWYESFPRTIVEAFAQGLPVIASRLGAMAEIIEDGRTGLLFEAGNPDDMARAMREALARPERMREMGRRARATYEALYSPEVNLSRLLAIYREAMGAVGRTAAAL
jgi:glycosyltransferase involved in cell wall biosynthesis